MTPARPHLTGPELVGLPVLDTERLILRAPQARDWPAFRDYRASPRMADWAFGPLGLTFARAEVHRDNAASHAIARRLGGQVSDDDRPTWFAEGAVYHFARRGNP